jgi:hypothetical protein
MFTMPNQAFSRTIIATLLATTAVLSGCSSSGGGSTTMAITGSVFAAPVSGAGCEIQDSSGTMIMGSITTSASGQYNVSVPNRYLDEDLMLVCSGGTYTDEVDGSTQTAGTLAAYVAGGTLGSGAAIHVTPESTIIQQLVANHGQSFGDAKTDFLAAFGYTPDTTIAPTDATSPASGASDDELLAGLRAAAFSQLTMDLSLTPAQQFALLTALAQDLSDGTLDGVDASGAITVDGTVLDIPADIQNRFAVAMLAFHNNSARNNTGLTNDNIGTLPFAKKALTSTYKVDYIPGTMAAMEGKTRFQVRLTRRDNDTAGTGISVTLMPMMHMATMMHASPKDSSCIESSTAGTYDCTVYYLMASRMANGSSMGYWDLGVKIDDSVVLETAHFYPSVMMAMGDTARADLKGVTDEIMSMSGGTEKRRYHIFKSSLTGMTGNHTFQVFIAARESMMSFPAVADDSLIFNAGTMYELTATPIIIEMSTDLSSWCNTTEDGNGYWSCSGLADLTNGTEGEIYVRLSISGEQKTTNGMAADSSNDYATFTVTPGMSM